MSDNQRVNERMRLIRFRMKREHLRFADEIRLIPREVMWVVVALYLVAQTIAQVVNHFDPMLGPASSEGESALAVAGIVTAASIPIACIILLIAYVNRDAKRRGMNSGLWTFLVIVMLPGWLFIGFVLYFTLREPLPYHCTQCGGMVSARFNYCPSCKYNLRPTCQHCQREVGEFDRYCPNCGKTVAPQTQPQD